MFKTLLTLFEIPTSSHRPSARELCLDTPRYFKDEFAFWRFEQGRTPQVKTAIAPYWIDSSFGSLSEFLEDPDGLTETTAEEAENPVWLQMAS